MLHRICRQYKTIITIENGTRIGGLGSAVSEFLTENDYKNTLKIIAVEDNFVTQGTVEELQKEQGLDYEGILETVKLEVSD
jgi:1-deoxy-D-xylulose-5-phosphate synthase